MYLQAFWIIPIIFVPTFRHFIPETVRICIIEVHTGYMIVLRLNKAFSKIDFAFTTFSSTATFEVRMPAA